MSITDELRKYAERVVTVGTRFSLTAIADRIDAEHERLMAERRRSCVFYDAERNYCMVHDEVDMADFGWIRLPKDANGEYVHIGDVMEFTYDPPQDQPMFEVSGFGAEGTLFYAARNEVAPRKTTKASVVRHHHEPTVEDVLWEFVSEFNRDDTELCDEEIIERFAAKFRLAKEGE